VAVRDPKSKECKLSTRLDRDEDRSGEMKARYVLRKLFHRMVPFLAQISSGHRLQLMRPMRHAAYSEFEASKTSQNYDEANQPGTTRIDE